MFRIRIFPLRIIHRHHSTSQMVNQQTTWSIPIRQTDEPVLKVYNSLTRSKVRLDRQAIGYRTDSLQRPNLFHEMANT